MVWPAIAFIIPVWIITILDMFIERNLIELNTIILAGGLCLIMIYLARIENKL